MEVKTMHTFSFSIFMPTGNIPYSFNVVAETRAEAAKILSDHLFEMRQDLDKQFPEKT